MTHFVIKIPGRCIVGDMTVMPTSFVYQDDALKHARERTVAPVNVSTRIDNTLYVNCAYVVISANSQDAALAIAKADPRCQELRKSNHTTYVE